MVLALLLMLMATGCHHHHRKAEELPPEKTAPVVGEQSPQAVRGHGGQRPAPIPPTPAPPGGVNEEDLEYVASHKPIWSERGIASWYRAPYKGRKMANGQVFDDNSMTAAQRTLPMGSLIKVTNLATGQNAVMRVTDRGPFIEGRVVDLTVASAKATGVYLPGSSVVRVDVYRAPKPIETGGRWCVQIGAISDENYALFLKQKLKEHYPDANVIEFPGENRFWVRIRPLNDDREQAEKIAHHLKLREGTAFLTRLD